MTQDDEVFSVIQAAHIALPKEKRTWLIDSLWSASAVGIIGGQPKCCKSWLALELAVSVASGTPCLGCFDVVETGPALVYLAEDGIAAVRERLHALSNHHGVVFEELDVRVITAGSIRLDLPKDQERLHNTIRVHRPKLLILDPLVRLHRLDENSAAEVSGLLSYLRILQREFDLAVVLVHHTRKNASARHPGQGLRGSGDFHAWADSSIYLRRNQTDIALTVEHRSAPAPAAIALRLITDAERQTAHFNIVRPQGGDPARSEPLERRILDLIDGREMTRGALREALAVKNERLGPVLASLESNGLIQRFPNGWRRRIHPADTLADPEVDAVPRSHT